MADPDVPPAPRSDFAFGLLVYALSGMVFFPLTRFLVNQTVNQDQLLHAFLVLFMAGVLLIYEKRVKLQPVWIMGAWSRWLLAGAYGLILVVLATGVTVLMIPAFCLAVSSAVILVFGGRVKRFTAGLVGAFAVFQGFVVLLPVLDWPLRGIAAQLSGSALHLIGRTIELRLYNATIEPALVLVSEGQEFLVAPECNGFGVTLSCLLLSLLLVLYRRIALWKKLGTLLFAVAFGLFSNAVRIVVIVLLAPLVGQDNYFVMHEIVGTMTYYAALIGIWYFIHRQRTTAPTKAAAPVESRAATAP